jgi:ribosomal protein L37E
MKADEMRIDVYDIIERKLPQASTPGEVLLLETVVSIVHVKLHLEWCQCCMHTKFFYDTGICYSCGFQYTTMQEYDASFPARH